MGHISSPAVQKVEDANFIAPKARQVMKANRIYRGLNDLIIVEIDKNRFVAARLIGYQKKYFHLAHVGHFGLIEAFGALGFLTKEEVEKHKKAVTERQRQQDVKYDIKELQTLNEKYGLGLTDQQIKKIKRNCTL